MYFMISLSLMMRLISWIMRELTHTRYDISLAHLHAHDAFIEASGSNILSFRIRESLR